MISKLKDRISSSKSNKDKYFIRNVLCIMKEFKYTYQEVLSLPIPVYMEILDFLKEIETNKKQQNGKK